MKILYLDCQSGISGDMTLSALIDLGANITYITDHLEKLPIDSFSLNVKQVVKKGISSKQLVLHFDEPVEHHHHHDHNEEQHEHNHESGDHTHDNHHEHDHHHHHLHDDHHHHNGHHHHEHRKASTILKMIEDSHLPARVKERSLSVFQVIAEAEGKIHGMNPKEVHFHEVGAMDSIIDIIGVCLALESLGVDKIIASPVPTGHGKLMMAHGLYPIPAPATAEILKGVPLADFHVKGELTTPTGAGFLKALTHEYGNIPPLPIENIGYGAGKKDFEHPNVLRAILFNAKETAQREQISVLECQLDDFTGEALGYLMEKLLGQGALDVYFTPVTMKKSRPGTLITVLAKPEKVFSLEELLLRETSTFGVRRSEWSRRILSREIKEVETAYGKINVKIGKLDGDIIKVFPEYEDVKKASYQHNVSFVEVYSEVEQVSKKQLIIF
jgi:pyridinium-3,5-bisthiocarboxylic acid mononucleotide nickel chelatase